jgi:hypothetical protein
MVGRTKRSAVPAQECPKTAELPELRFACYRPTWWKLDKSTTYPRTIIDIM